MIQDRFVPLFVVLPLLGAFLIPLLSRVWKGFADLIANLVGASLLGVAIYGIYHLSTGASGAVYRMGNWMPPLGITLVFDSLTALIVLLINIVGFVALLFSIRYLDPYTGRWKYYTLFMIMLAGMNGVALAGDMFNMFVFIEISAISSYALVAFGTEAEEIEAGFKYLVMGEIGSITILFSIAMLYAHTSTLNMADMSRVLAELPKTPFYWFVLSTMLTGFAIKMAMVPFHSWLPDAHLSAPAPVSAVLSGVFIKVLGVYTMSRVVFNVFGLNRVNAPALFNMLVAFGLVSIIVGALLAMTQKNYKRLLAYSSVSQIGYILLGIGIGNYWGVVGALFHVLSHAVAKGLLFLASRSIERQTGTKEIMNMGGLEKTMPVTTWSYIAGALSLAGVPPFAGFFSKLLILLGAVSAGLHWMALVAALFSVITLGYLLKVINRMFFSPGGIAPPLRESPRLILFALIILVVLSAAFGLGFKQVLEYIIGPAASALFHGLAYAQLVLGG